MLVLLLKKYRKEERKEGGMKQRKDGRGRDKEKEKKGNKRLNTEVLSHVAQRLNLYFLDSDHDLGSQIT